ncbi:hydroxynicotinate 3-monooxygenase [Seminavis robusta]|uniref:Hydroxynicotinate 3-monooxygenase n=1 Tax=Seminavis robusta TaxID=568900 RepID=A0A9N8E5Y8_9STRA|nr:hydroxynicotinate 3-monooxygenase [Seminavis robusta]|eukprot:Sro707_g190620.1 hydroxynicotinate 3-monooxygenase (490) ;mRNA; r:37744-39369
MAKDQSTSVKQEPAKIVIVGGGIVGLIFAMAVKRHCGITCEIYEKATKFYDEVGAALGMYPNGLRVIRDIDPDLLRKIQEAGAPYVYRRWERHDGTEIAAAKEDELTEGDWELSSIGIRRWKLQKVLFQAAVGMGIPFHFCKATKDVVVRDDGLVDVLFEDGSQRTTQLLFGCDGAHSKVREVVAGDATSLEYTGVTCLMGIAENCPVQQEGISFPSSHTTGCHSVYFPTGPNEQCFQVHWPIPVEQANSGNWGNLTDTMSKQECQALAKRLEQDGWHPRFIEPLHHVTHAVRVGFALMKPRLKKWAYGKNKRVVLVGDAAHPPVPYIGQGAQMGIEDAGTMAWLLKKLCVDYKGNFTLKKFDKAVEIYEKIRIPRTSHILDCSKELGKMQELREDLSAREDLELMIQGELMMNGTLPVMFQGASHHYRMSADKELRKFELEEERNAISAYMPGVFELSDAECKRDAKKEEEEMRLAFEAMMYGGAPCQ